MAHDTDNAGLYQNRLGLGDFVSRTFGSLNLQKPKNGEDVEPMEMEHQTIMSTDTEKHQVEGLSVAEQIESEMQTLDARPRAPVRIKHRPSFRRRIGHQVDAISDNISSSYSRLNGYAAKRVSPPLGNFGRAVAKHLRFETIEQFWRSFLLDFHEKVVDRKKEQLFFVPTSVEESLDQLTVKSSHKRFGRDYKPTPSKTFLWAMEALPRDLRHFSFVDFGAGRGRVMLLASRRNFRRVIGAEFAQELHDDAQMNIAQFPRSLMRCRDVECYHVTASKLPMPNGAAVFYFFDPFDKPVMRHVLDRIVETYRFSPRRFYLIFVDVEQDDLIDSYKIFEPLSYSRSQRIKQKLFSPYPIKVYRTLV